MSMTKLKQILNSGNWDYGGPVLGHDGTDYVLYEWFDAPVATKVMARGETIKTLVENFSKKVRFKSKRKK